jgi:hypothetical protein
LTCISGTAGGGGSGTVDGIAHGIITGDGVTIATYQVFITMWTRVGEDTTGIVIGTDTGGTMKGFLTDDFNRTGGAGIIINIGKDEEHGASRVISLDTINRNRN